MRITDVTTTTLVVPDLPGIKDSTIRTAGKGRGSLFVHIKTDEGIEGFGVGIGESRSVIEGPLKSVLVGEDPLCHEKLWEDMFWKVRGYGRKGVARKCRHHGAANGLRVLEFHPGKHRRAGA